MDQATLQKGAALLEEVAVRGQDWVSKHEDQVRNMGASPEQARSDLRKQARMARKLQRAAGRRMCVGVFGPSQAGKSYLLSSLARDQDGNVTAMFGDQTSDFLRDLNPFGGKESTGLVTRFTLKRPDHLPDGFPVQVRLFSETELVKILANTYYRDGQHKEKVDKEEIRRQVEQLRSRAGSGSSPVDLDAMEDLREYIFDTFGGYTRAAALEDAYWTEAVELAQKLPLEDRAKLFAVIWENIPEFTELFLSLARDLERLGNPDEAYLAMDALLPREASILDVETLGKTDFSAYGAAPTVKIKSKDGPAIEISRKNATAIIAELTVVMGHKPAEYFEHTDLLDFPGYKGRLECSNISAYMREGKEDSAPEQFFRRGKVDYLFQRYSAENELTSLLLCVATTDQTQGLAGVVEDWIKTTHGSRPEDRLKAHTALFYVLTKADRYFEEKQGDIDALWDNVIEGNFLAHFGRNRSQATRWVKEWTPGQSFNNLFLLRSLGVSFPAVMRYEKRNGVNHEAGIREESNELVSKVREVFLASQLVRAHFSDPARALDELLKPDDGGMTYIKQSLEPVCEPGLKLGQLSQLLQSLAGLLISTLSPYHKSGDHDQELKKKLAFFASFGKLFSNPYFQERFPELLAAFKISPDMLYYLRGDADKRHEEYKNQKMAALRQESAAEPAHVDPGDDPLDFLAVFDEPAPAKQTAQPIGGPDENSFYAQMILETWGSRMRALGNREEAQEYFQFTTPVFLGMLGELEQAIVRLGIQQKLERKFREIADPVDVSRESKARKQSAFAIGVLNDFVSWLGKNPAEVPQSQRSVDYRGERVTVFRNRPPVEDYPHLPETFVPFSRQWYKDWLTAFYGLLVDNASFVGGEQVDVESNRVLGELIKKAENARVGA